MDFQIDVDPTHGVIRPTLMTSCRRPSRFLIDHESPAHDVKKAVGFSMRYSLMPPVGCGRGNTRFLLFFTTLEGMYAHENEAYTPGIFLVVEASLRRGLDLPHASGIASVTAIPRLNQSWPYSLTWEHTPPRMAKKRRRRARPSQHLVLPPIY